MEGRVSVSRHRGQSESAKTEAGSFMETAHKRRAIDLNTSMAIVNKLDFKYSF